MVGGEGGTPLDNLGPVTVYQFVQLIEIGPPIAARLLGDAQDSIIRDVAHRVTLSFMEKGCELDTPKIARMEGADEFIAIHFPHDRHDFRLDLHGDKIVLIKQSCPLKELDEFAGLIEPVPKFVYDAGKEHLKIPLRDYVRDFVHRFTIIIRLLGDKKNYDIVRQLLRVSESALSQVPPGDTFRLDLTWSLGTNTEPRRNFWIELEAPANEDSSQIWLTCAVKPYPVERLQAAERRKTIEELPDKACDVQTSLSAFLRGIVLDRFAVQLLQGLQAGVDYELVK